MPGGGGTPLAAAIEAAAALAAQAQRRGETPTLIILSDGRANVSRDGAPGRETAHAQALKAARVVAAAGITALFIDTSPRPHELARDLAAQMRARYLALPFANARLNDIVRAAGAARKDPRKPRSASLGLGARRVRGAERAALDVHQLEDHRREDQLHREFHLAARTDDRVRA